LSIFDLLFLAAALASIATLGAASLFLVSGRWKRALAILRGWAVCAAVYLAAAGISQWRMPVLALQLHDPQCSDDWCLSVEGAGRDRAQPEIVRVALRISSRAQRVPQRERGLVVYLTDAAGRRYDPLPNPADVPLDRQLAPGESADLTRAFRIPAEARQLQLVAAHEGGFPIAWLIIGREPFERTVVRLD